LLALALEARAAFRGSLLVNSRADLALACGAAGVHLPADGLPAAALRRIFGRRLLLGCSTHHLQEVERAQREGADYVTFGPIYETPSKARFGPPVGLPALRRATAIGLPVYALGGVTLERFGELAEAGAAGVAAIRLFVAPAAQLVRLSEAARLGFIHGERGRKPLAEPS
jgi:thiamine-phosphate pyrophosphorylase